MKALSEVLPDRTFRRERDDWIKGVPGHSAFAWKSRIRNGTSPPRGHRTLVGQLANSQRDERNAMTRGQRCRATAFDLKLFN